MVEFSERWLGRLRRAISGLNWVFVTVGIVGIFLGPIGWQEAAAIVLALAYVITIQSVPLSWLRRPLSREALVVTSTAAIAVAAALSGGFRSPFVLLTITPIVIAALVGGYRLGVATALLSVSLTSLSEIAGGAPDWPLIAVWVGFGIIVGVTFGLARKLILELVQQADVIAALSAETGAQLERLQSANSLLTRFEDLTVAAELDPESVGATLLDSVRSLVPYSYGTVQTANRVEVAALGTAPEKGSEMIMPIVHNGRKMGRLTITTNREVTQRQRDIIGDLTVPVGLAFANIEAVQRIARSAIHEERARVARELHDGIGPALATLGLALDVAQMQSGDLPGVAKELGSMRESVTTLVQDVRSTVEDLRSPDSRPLEAILSSLPLGDVELVYELEERAPMRSGHAPDVNAIVIEATRNALRHSNADRITVTGHFDRDNGRIEVIDNGSGFSVDSTYPGHFGLVGMKERAARLGGALAIESDDDGTCLTLDWPLKQ